MIAVDPSAAMLRLGRALDAGAHRNIRWLQARAEDAELDAPVDLVTAGASLHWMDPAELFPKLARIMTPDAVLALVDGDAPTDAPWIEAYQAVIVGWVERLGDTWNGAAHRERMSRHDPWFDIQGRETFTACVRQPLEPSSPANTPAPPGRGRRWARWRTRSTRTCARRWRPGRRMG